MSACSIPVELRPHDGYTFPMNGGYDGYQARCWDCDWTGPEHLRGDEPMGSDASRAHKAKARMDAGKHSRENKIPCCSKCKRALTVGEDE